MACFLVPAVEAAVVTAASRTMKKKLTDGNAQGPKVKLAFSHKLKWLSNLLWGGSALLAFEHVWHGEVTPWFPFLTAMNDPADTAEMLAEMSTVGVTMAVIITAVWGGMVAVSYAMEKKAMQSGLTMQGGKIL